MGSDEAMKGFWLPHRPNFSIVVALWSDRHGCEPWGLTFDQRLGWGNMIFFITCSPWTMFMYSTLKPVRVVPCFCASFAFSLSCPLSFLSKWPNNFLLLPSVPSPLCTTLIDPSFPFCYPCRALSSSPSLSLSTSSSLFSLFIYPFDNQLVHRFLCYLLSLEPLFFLLFVTDALFGFVYLVQVWASVFLLS